MKVETFNLILEFDKKVVRNKFVIRDQTIKRPGQIKFVYSPKKTFQEMSKIMDLFIGKLFIVGTPGRVSLKYYGHDESELEIFMVKIMRKTVKSIFP